MKTIGELRKHKPFPDVGIKISKEVSTLPQTQDFIGVEVEVEHVDTDALLEQFSTALKPIFLVERDGSLRNNGAEFISRKGLKFYEVVQGLHVLLNIIYPKLDQRWEASKRTSIHVHWNVNPYTEEQLKQIVLVYLAAEKALVEVSGGRSNNIFCIPNIYNPQIWTPWLSSNKPYFGQLVTGGFFTNMDWGKYSALNLRPLRDQGTIEFRSHAGTLNFNEIVSWLYTINNVITTALRFRSVEETLNALEQMLSTNYYRMLQQMLVVYDGTNLKPHGQNFSPQFYDNISKLLLLLKLPNNTDEFIPEVKGVSATRVREVELRNWQVAAAEMVRNIEQQQNDVRNLDQFFAPPQPIYAALARRHRERIVRTLAAAPNVPRPRRRDRPLD